MVAERTLALVETSDSFQAFTDKQKRRYRQAIGELRVLFNQAALGCNLSHSSSARCIS